jgi:hypothetical protein
MHSGGARLTLKHELCNSPEHALDLRRREMRDFPDNQRLGTGFHFGSSHLLSIISVNTPFSFLG